MKRIFIYFLFLLCFPLSAQVNQIEYFFDADPGYGKGINAGSAQTFEDTDKEVLQSLSFNAPLVELEDGYHNLYIRVKGNNGWSQTQSVPFVKMTLPGEESHEVIYLEYFFDEDPGYKAGVSLDVAHDAGNQYSYTIDLNGLDEGFHALYVRALNKYGKWSQVMSRPVYKTDLSESPEIIYAEYYFDTDPGKTNGSQFLYDPNQTAIDFTADISSLTDGNHIIFIRGKYKNENWEDIGSHHFTVIDPTFIETPENDLAINVYPNPVVDELFIKNKEGDISAVKVFDANGQIHYSRKFESQTIIQIPFDSYQAGIYFIEVSFMRKKEKIFRLVKRN